MPNVVYYAEPEEQEGDDEHGHDANHDNFHGDVALGAVDRFSRGFLAFEFVGGQSY